MARNDANAGIEVGDLDGLNRIYGPDGGVLTKSGETVLGVRDRCELGAFESWRKLFAPLVFESLRGASAGRVFVTTERLVFLREIDTWKQVKASMSPLGLPGAVVKEAELNRIKGAGGRQYFQLWTSGFSLAWAKRVDGLIGLRLVGRDGRKWRVVVHADIDDPPFFALIEGRFPRAGHNAGAVEVA